MQDKRIVVIESAHNKFDGRVNDNVTWPQKVKKSKSRFLLSFTCICMICVFFACVLLYVLCVLCVYGPNAWNKTDDENLWDTIGLSS